MKVKFFNYNCASELMLNDFTKDKIVVDIQITPKEKFIIIYYTDQKVVTVDCSKLNLKEKEQFVRALTKVTFNNDKDVIVNHRIAP